MGSTHCFVCGPNNPFGLHIHFEPTATGVEAEFLCEERHCGWPGIQHGGITSAILDEACAYVPYFQNLVTMTAELKVHYSAPIHQEENLKITAHALRTTRRLLDVEAKIHGPNGDVKATALAKMMVLSERQQRENGLIDEVDASASSK